MSLAQDQARLLELEREQWHRECRRSFQSFCVEALAPLGQRPALHHVLIIRELQALADGGAGAADRLMILAPPGSAKSTYVSRLYPTWFLARHPGAQIIGASHTAGLAEENSGHVQRLILDYPEMLGYGLATDAKDKWQTSTRGEYRAFGVGGGVRGFRADLALIDDPIRTYAEADSETLRESTWSWFTVDLLSRWTPSMRIVMIATPMHEDDLMGRLLRVQPERWKVVRLPALSEGVGDLLGRPEGAPLWDDDGYGYGGRLLAVRAEMEQQGKSRDWHSQYQGRPRPAEGALFYPNMMPIIEPGMIPEISMRVRAWDFAASASRGDWTVGLLLGRSYQRDTWESRWVVLDVQRVRAGPEEVRALVRRVAEADGGGTKIWLPRDPGSAGVDQVDSMTRLLTGYSVRNERMTGSKETRAEACAAQSNMGRVSMVRALWNAAFIEELAAFPRGVHDDQVDALSLAFSKMDSDALAVWMKL
jgi:predicted phage terminase large subunit-like protein